MPRPHHLFIAAPALLLAVSACTSSAVPCAGVGVDSGVSLMFVREGYGDLVGASYELCARGECVDGTLPPENVTRLRLMLPLDVDPDSGPVRFRVTPVRGTEPVIDASTDVELRHQSDGCGSGAYNRALAFTKEDGLLGEVPASVMKAWREDLERPAPSTSPAPSASPSAGTAPESA
ncbi:hypothetical protein PV416_24140 [Streptomyces ipomoeae]|uniref:hypothetical protein n=1 Tax=Streptomyces ipomoeae TaxID=103232 RepID=UPI0029A075FD|nr:hypothetical protein [Streptomyces ipomoeae]MDX2697664.1 hypothetical protein [Streptomyces ipomoeae]MDX2824105.1 hypothetical protein [Streptomyces ipomoeae]MDX2842295.1 hypothetical protein [Streptomyces ipomoeae]MDX2876686.1 hypothetical protein [Streptomyces ipomoeae]